MVHLRITGLLRFLTAVANDVGWVQQRPKVKGSVVTYLRSGDGGHELINVVGSVYVMKTVVVDIVFELCTPPALVEPVGNSRATANVNLSGSLIPSPARIYALGVRINDLRSVGIKIETISKLFEGSVIA